MFILLTGLYKEKIYGMKKQNLGTNFYVFCFDKYLLLMLLKNYLFLLLCKNTRLGELLFVEIEIDTKSRPRLTIF